MEQALQTMIEQMVLALDQAIADAQTAKDISYFAFDGELLSQSGAHWVVSLVGTTLMLSTREPIPGQFLKKVTLIEDTVWLLERQREVLKAYLEGQLEEAPGGYAAKVLDLQPVRYGTRRVRGTFGPFTPDEQQKRAIEHGLGSERTIIVGPGGTGKSAVQALLGNRFLKEDLSILAVSHTNIATDNLFLRLVQFAEASGDADLLHLLRSQRMVRLGDPRHRSLLTGAYQHLTVNSIAEERLGDLAQTRLRLEEAQRTLAKRIESLARHLQQQEERWQVEWAQLEPQIEALQGALSELEERKRKRIESIDRGIREEGEKCAAAKKQLVPLVARQEELERQLRQWQGDLHVQTPDGEWARRQARLAAAQQVLAQLQGRGAFRRFLAGERHELDVAAAMQEIAARQDELDEADQAISTLNSDLQQNRLEQIGPQVTMEKAESEIKRLGAAYGSTYFTDQMRPHRKKLEPLLKTRQEGEHALEVHRAALESARSEKSRNEARLAELKAYLATVKTQIVAEARLVAATITGVYLNPDLLRRQFDGVLVDEISMISVIAALLVALRATRYFVASGDPMQLLPILKTVCSDQERAVKMPEALKWLARDLLSYLGVTIFDAITGEKGCVLLVQQGRMHPKILAPINHYVYRDMLISRPETENAPPIAPLPNAPLMLVDSSTSPESRTYKPSKNESRVNEHHVKIAVALVPQVLASLPARSTSEDKSVPRIGVLTPYRSQAKHLLRALRDAKLDQHVHAGTINTAQALEFEVVILDTVEAPGLTPFSFTMDRILDEYHMATGATRRWNVGQTRACHKLIYIAHLDYLHRHQPKNPTNDPARQRLLVELADWAAREGYITSLEVLRVAEGEQER